METVRPAGRKICFGVFEVDLRAGELRKHGIKIKLQEQPFQILQTLLENPGEVVTREELRQRLWASDTFVDFEHGLYNGIKRLREGLGDSAENPRYLETLSKRGYRFIAPVEVRGTASTSAAQETAKPSGAPRPPCTLDEAPTLGSAGAGAPAAPAAPRRNAVRVLVTFAFAALLLGLFLGVNGNRFRQWFLAGSGSPPIRSLAVLPFQNLSSDPTQEYFSDGMTDALITDLSQIGSLKVISRTSTMLYKKPTKPLPEIARELNVDGIIEGTVQRFGDHVRITVQLIQGTSDKHIWAASYERDTPDVFVLERDLTEEIASQVQARLTMRQAPLAQPRPMNLNALEAYLQGNYHLQKGRMGVRDKELRIAGEYFQHAIDAVPDFALAYVGLAEAHHNLFWPSSEDFALMRRAAEKAVALDPASSEARTELALTKWEDWDWSGAEEEFRRAISLNPNNAFAHDQLAECLDATGRLEEGRKEFELAQELDPNQDHLSDTLYRQGDYDASTKVLQKALESRPNDAVLRYFLAEDYAQKRMYKDWVREMGETCKLMGFRESADRIQQAFAASGYREARQQEARELERWTASKQAYFPGVLASVYTSLGDNDRAFYWLRQGIDHRHMAMSDDLQWFKVDPELAPLRSDPRFKDMLRRAGLPPS